MKPQNHAEPSAAPISNQANDLKIMLAMRIVPIQSVSQFFNSMSSTLADFPEFKGQFSIKTLAK